jgi:hypothetical protein
MKKHSYIAAILLVSGFARESLAGGFYSTGHDLMVEAIRSGQASGVMGGEIAKRFTEQFKSAGPLLVEAQTMTTYKQPGCARLDVNYTQKEVPTPQGVTAVHLNTQINYCLNGEAPRSVE